VTHLRKMMLEELQRCNYSESTAHCYIRTVEDFAKRFKRSPDRLGPEHIREYQAELFKKKLSPGTVTQRLAALRFFYIKTLKRAWSIAETPYPKQGFRLPTSNKSLFPTSPHFQFASILRCHNSLLGPRYIFYSAVRLSPPPTPSLCRFQIA